MDKTYILISTLIYKEKFNCHSVYVSQKCPNSFFIVGQFIFTLGHPKYNNYNNGLSYSIFYTTIFILCHNILLKK